MNIVKALLLSAVLLLPARSALAQLYFRNHSKAPVLVAYALKGDPKAAGTWFTQGWYRVQPKERVMLNKTIGTFNLFYYYAMSADGKQSFDGTMQLWVDALNPFVIQEPSKMETGKGHPTYQRRLFRVVRLPEGSQLKEYTIEFQD